MSTCFANLSERVERIGAATVEGRVRSVSGLMLVAQGLDGFVGVGQRCLVHGRSGSTLGEVVGVHEQGVQVLPFGTWSDVAAGNPVEVVGQTDFIRPSDHWIGRVVDGLGRPVDSIGSLPRGHKARSLRAAPPPAFQRRNIGQRVETGLRSIDLFVPLCRGQRLGVFAGSGVGKTTLLSELIRHAEADVFVIGLIGERGRELQSFIESIRAGEAKSRTVIVVSTGDEPPLARRQAAWTATSIAEHFRDQGQQVFLLIDSLTRFALAQREIGLAVGEPPAQRGFPPTTFSELPRLVERAGPGTRNSGDITAIYTVLVDGDDFDDPVSDGVRGMLDGHIVLDRSIAERGRFPAVNLLKSVSRMLPACHTDQENALLNEARTCLATYNDLEDLIRLGAYQTGSEPHVDRAVRVFEAVEALVQQSLGDRTDTQKSFGMLSEALRG